MSTVAVSIAVHNPDIKMFKSMLASLKKYETENITELIVIDNASKNRSEWENLVVGDSFNGFIINNTENVGFGRAHNAAVRMAHSKYILIVNDDVEFFEPFIKDMVDLLRRDATIMQVGMKRGVCDKLDMYATAYQHRENEEPDYIEASCMMMRVRDAISYGPFNEAYEFAYFEDSDLSLRIKKDAGKIAQVDKDWIHYRAKTSGSSEMIVDIKGYHANNAYLFRKDWMSYLIAGKFGPHIVVRRTGAIGDVLLTLPVLEALKEKYGEDCTIGLATQNPQAITQQPFLNIIYTQPFYPIPCNLFIDLDSAYESDNRANYIDCYARKAGVQVSRYRVPLTVTKDQFEAVSQICPDHKDQKYVSFDLSDTWPERQWSYENYKELAKRIRAFGYRVVLIGKCDYTNKKEFIDADVDVVNQFGIIETALILSKMYVHIGHDGLLMHLAQATDRQCIGLYGCTLPYIVNDRTSKTLHPILTSAVCRGCRHRYAAGNAVLCPRDAECMKMITVDEVADKFLSVVKDLNGGIEICKSIIK